MKGPHIIIATNNYKYETRSDVWNRTITELRDNRNKSTFQQLQNKLPDVQDTRHAGKNKLYLLMCISMYYVWVYI